MEEQGKAAIYYLLSARTPAGVDDWNRTRMFETRPPNLRGVVPGRFLEEMDLHACILDRAQFLNTDMKGAILKDASLRGAKLGKAKDLEAWQFAGTDVTDAELPDKIADFSGLETVKIVSIASRRIFLLMLFACAYSWLIALATRHVDLVLGSGATEMPILGTAIPTTLAYTAVPLLLACLYVYLHINLQKMWYELSLLPAVFPDGRRLDQKAHPWLLLSVTAGFIMRLKKDRAPHWWLEVGVSVLLAWGLVPATIGAFWLRHLVTHEWRTAWIHVFLVSGSLTAGGWFFFLGRRTLKEARVRRSHSGGIAHPGRKLWRRCAVGFVVAVSLFAAFSWAAIEGVPDDFAKRAATGDDVGSLLFLGARVQIPRVLALLRCDVFANLEEEELSTVPSNWNAEEGSLSRVKGARLEGAKLEYMAARGAILPRAHLRNATLRGADLRGAIMCGADLSGVDFTGADLRGANLRGVQNWRQVRSVKGARIGEIRNAPEGFIDWALGRGATQNTAVLPERAGAGHR